MRLLKSDYNAISQPIKNLKLLETIAQLFQNLLNLLSQLSKSVLLICQNHILEIFFNLTQQNAMINVAFHHIMHQMSVKSIWSKPIQKLLQVKFWLGVGNDLFVCKNCD